MNERLPVLANFQVASPCDASWDEMSGDDAKRFCGKCEKHVYNLPLLTPDELVDLIEMTEGKFCGRLFARQDGTVLTDDCPVGLSRKLARARTNKQVGASAAIAALCYAVGAAILAASWGGVDVGPQPMLAGEIAPIEQPIQEPIVEPGPPKPQNDFVMGKIAIEPQPQIE